MTSEQGDLIIALLRDMLLIQTAMVRGEIVRLERLAEDLEHSTKQRGAPR